MSQQPNNSIDIPLLGEGAEDFIIGFSPIARGADFALKERPKIIGKDNRPVWTKFSDWIFDGILPDTAPKFRGQGASQEEREAKQSAFAKKHGDREFIDKDASDPERLAADLLVGFADEGVLPMGDDPAQDVADDILMEMARNTIADENSTPEDRASAVETIGDRALRQLLQKQTAEGGLADVSSGEGLAKRIVELWADGSTDEQISDELSEAGWDYTKADKKLVDRLGQEVEILNAEGEFGKAMGLGLARLNIMKNGGPPDVNGTPYDTLLDEFIRADAKGMSKSDAFSIAGSDAFLSTIRGIGRLTGVGYTTPKDQDILEKMTEAAFEEHPVTSLAGSFAGGFVDPVFFAFSMGIAKAPVTSIQKSRYIKDLVGRGIPVATAERIGARATLETIATHQLSKHFLTRGLSLKAAQATGALTWNTVDAAISNGLAEGIVAGGEGDSPADIAIRSFKGAGTGAVMGVVFDRALRGIDSISRAIGTRVPKEATKQIDMAIDFAAAQGPEGKQLSTDLRAYVNTLDQASKKLGRKLTVGEVEEIARTQGIDLGGLAVARTAQVQELKTQKAQAKKQGKGKREPGQELSELEKEAIERGILKAPETPLTDAQRSTLAAERDADLEAQAVEVDMLVEGLAEVSDEDLALRAKTAKGNELEAVQVVIAERAGIEREGVERGVLKETDETVLTPEQRSAKAAKADKELEEKFGPGLEAGESRLKPKDQNGPDSKASRESSKPTPKETPDVETGPDRSTGDTTPAPAVQPGRDAKGPRTGEAPPPPSKQPVGGRETGIRIPERSEPLKARYAIVESDDLIPSHDARDGFKPNKYGDINERPYNDPTEGKVLRQRVKDISDDIDPEFLLSDTPTAVDGPPIVNPDLVVLGGNARAMAQQVAYKKGNAGDLDAATRASAERFGISTDGLDQFKNPVLVRVVDAGDAGAPGELSRDLNQSFTGSRTSDADAVSRSSKITPAAARRIAVLTRETSLGAVFNAPAPTAKLQTILGRAGVYTEAELGSLVDQRGLFTQSGRRQIEQTLLGYAVPDVRRLAEVAPSTRNTLIKALPALTTLRATGIESDGFDKTLGNTLDMLRELNDSGSKSIDDLISQSTLNPQPWRSDAPAIELARAFASDNQSAIIKRLNSMADVADDIASGQGRFFDKLQDPDAGALPKPDKKSSLSTRGPRDGGRKPGENITSTERDIPQGITGHNLETIKGVPGDQMNLGADPTPQSGVDPGIKRADPPDWVKKPATTRRGKKTVGRINGDPKGLKYGVRSIAETLTNDLDPLLVRQTREQSSSKNPAHYAPDPHMIRTRSASEPNWMFHEQGHAISSILRQSNKKFISDFKNELISLTGLEGSFASSKSPEEGFAEFIRLLITAPRKIEKWPHTARIMAAIESASPQTFEAIRDATRGFDAHMRRPLEARWRSYMTDTKSATGRSRSVVANAMVDYVSRGNAADFAMNKVLVQVRKDAKSMREGWRAVAKLESKIKNTAADMIPAYQSLNHIPQMVNVALEGPGPVKAGAPTGLRVHATVIPEQLKGTAFDRAGIDKDLGMLSVHEREVLEGAGFKVPAEPKNHGDIVVLADKSVADAIAPIKKGEWPGFESYAQMKATVARIKARALEGQPFPYQTRGEGASPIDLIQSIKKSDKANPHWAKVFDDLEEIMNSTLLLDVLSGELTASDAIKLKNRFEHYLPLTRQGEGGPRSIKSGPTAAPSANIRRSTGSVNPAEPILTAMSRKLDEAINAYYWNRFAMSPIMLSQTLRKMDDVPRSAKIAANRMGIHLELDTKKLASASPDEVKIAIHKYIVDEVLQGNELINISPEEIGSFTVDDIGIVDGFDIWRKVPPKAVNVIAPNIRGSRQYYQILDDNLFRIFTEGGESVNSIARISEQAFGSTTQGLKNQITQTFSFTMRNLFRDSMTAVLFGKDAGALVPGFYHAVGAISLLTKRGPDTLVSPELLSRVFREVSTDDFAKQRSKSMEALAEGLVPRGWRDMNALSKALTAPGIAVRVLLKPLEIKQILTGQRWLASAMETAPRQGAFIMAKRRGLSDEAAQLAADTVTGNFSERPLSSSAHSIYRTAGFLNPAFQIFNQQAKFLTDPVPARGTLTAATRMGNIAFWTGVAWSLNRLAQGPEDRKRNMERTEKERVTHMEIKGLRIPFDYGIPGGVQSYTWNMLDELDGQRGVSGEQIARKMLTEVFPHTSINPLEFAPMALKAGTEAQIGYSLYRGERLEPSYMDYMDAPDRFFDTTPDLYRWVGRMTNASPIRVGYFARNGLGVQLDDMVKLLDRIDEGFHVDELASLPEVGRMFSREPIGWNSRSVRDAATLSDEYDGLRRRAQAMSEAGDVDQEALAEVVALLEKLEPIKNAMLEVQDLYTQAKDSVKGDPERSRELKRKMVEVARRGLIEMDDLDHLED